MHKYTEYFKTRLDFERFIKLLYKKYKSRGTFSGTIHLNNITPKEAMSFSRLFGTTYMPNDNLIISISKFIKIMENSKYTDFQIDTLVSEYLGIDLTTNTEDKKKDEELELTFYQNTLKPDSKGSNWLKKVVTTKNTPYTLIHKRYNTNKDKLKRDLTNIINLIDNIPKEDTLLSIFASTYTEDPHYLDIDTKNINLFLYALADLNNTNYPNTREEKIRLLADNNIKIDMLSNYVLTYQILSDKDYINAFSYNHQSLILNIQNILNSSTFTTPNRKVFILENPSILTEVIERKLNLSIIISGGFPNISVHLLIDDLIKNNNKIYYNGDLDPEGLIIAENFKKKYKEHIKLFGYNEEDYKKSISQKEVSSARLNKLSKVMASDLQEVRTLLLNYKLAAYQENNKERIINQMLEIMNVKGREKK